MLTRLVGVKPNQMGNHMSKKFFFPVGASYGWKEIEEIRKWAETTLRARMKKHKNYDSEKLDFTLAVHNISMVRMPYGFYGYSERNQIAFGMVFACDNVFSMSWNHAIPVCVTWEENYQTGKVKFSTNFDTKEDISHLIYLIRCKLF